MEGQFQHGYAVVIGAGADLPVTIDDAAAVSSLLRDPTRCAYPPDHVALLTGEDASRSHVLAALDSLVQQTGADPEATAVVYFSGHGLELPESYLMPFGYRLDDLRNTALSGKEFNERLRAIQARKVVILLDTCHAAGQADAKAALGAPSPVPPEVLNELQRGSGRVVIASSRKDEVSYAGQPHSVFTTALLEAFSGYGVFEPDGYARVLDLAMYVGRMVPERTGDRQHPIIKVANLEENYALAFYAAGAAQPKGLDWPAGGMSKAADWPGSQAETWMRMLANYRDNLLLIEERMSEYVEYQEIPLQLVKNKRSTLAQINDLEARLKQRDTP